MVRRLSWRFQVDDRVAHALVVLNLAQAEDVVAHHAVAESRKGLQLQRPDQITGVLTAQRELVQIIWHQMDELNDVLDMLLEVLLELLRLVLVCLVLLLGSDYMLLTDVSRCLIS